MKDDDDDDTRRGAVSTDVPLCRPSRLGCVRTVIAIRLKALAGRDGGSCGRGGVLLHGYSLAWKRQADVMMPKRIRAREGEEGEGKRHDDDGLEECAT